MPPKYQIKLNDEIVDSDSMINRNSTMKGTLKKGIAYNSLGDNSKSQKREERGALFEGGKTFPVGPGYYDVKDDMVYSAKPVLPIAQTGRNQPRNLQKQMESYLQKIL